MARQGDKVAVLKIAGIGIAVFLTVWFVGGWIWGLFSGEEGVVGNREVRRKAGIAEREGAEGNERRYYVETGAGTGNCAIVYTS